MIQMGRIFRIQRRSIRCNGIQWNMFNFYIGYKILANPTSSCMEPISDFEVNKVERKFTSGKTNLRNTPLKPPLRFTSFYTDNQILSGKC